MSLHQRYSLDYALHAGFVRCLRRTQVASRRLRRLLSAIVICSAPVLMTACAMPASNSAGNSPWYVDTASAPALWLQKHPDDPQASRIREQIASVPMAIWFGAWNSDVHQAVQAVVDHAAAAHGMPVLVAYNIPDRDCGGASAGGAASADAYRTWMTQFAQGIGQRHAMVILEPDALSQLSCFKSEDQRADRVRLLHDSVTLLRAQAPGADVFIDAGNAHWIPATEMAARLNTAGLEQASGFALNVSNFYTTDESVTYAQAVNAALQAQYGYHRRYIVDTSRNGNGANGQWCNPPGRKLGGLPGATLPADGLTLWIKSPGSSDGACGTAPDVRAGEFSPALAAHLIDGN